MKIVVVGTRGFPGVQGGVEKHCEHLYPRLAKRDCKVICFARAPYTGKDSLLYEGVEIRPLPCPRNKFLETIVHTRRAILAAVKLKPDILHIHAIGPSLLVPLAKSLGLKVVMTHHGQDYKRAKWNKLAKRILKISEAMGCRNADAIISITASIAQGIEEKFGRNPTVIPNGVDIPERAVTRESLVKYGLEAGKYVLTVSRFVPEKGLHDLIEAFEIASAASRPRNDWQKSRPRNDWQESVLRNDGQESRLRNDGQESVLRNDGQEYLKGNIKLVIVGDADHEDKYSRKLKAKAGKNPNIVLTGRLNGVPLQELYSHAGLFVLPSYYEGLPIVLLEAMSYGLPCVVSDIPANKEAGLEKERYFTPGDVLSLTEKITQFMGKPETGLIESVRVRYNWETIADRTMEVYKTVLK